MSYTHDEFAKKWRFVGVVLKKANGQKLAAE